MKIKNLFLVLLCLVTLCSSIPCFASSGQDIEDVFIPAYSDYFVGKFLRDYYGLYSMQDFKCTLKSDAVAIDVENLSQSDLNQNYETQTGKSLDGTCTAVAIVSLISHYKSSINTNVAFKNLVSQAINKKYASAKGTIHYIYEKKCITLCASQNGISGSGENYWYNKRARTREALNAGTPVFLGFNRFEHSVLAKGVMIYTISYKNPSTGKKVTKDVEFFYVNEGWGRANGSVILSEFFSDSTGDAYILK